MRIERAVVVLPVLAGDAGLLDDCLEQLVAAADEASAAGVPTALVPVLAPGSGAARLLASWEPLVALLDGVELRPVRLGAAPGARDADAVLAAGAVAAAAREARPSAVVVLVTAPHVAVGSRWITEHVHHHAGGAQATTGPVRGASGAHPARLNLALRADLLRRCGSAALHGAGDRPVVHALTPSVGLLTAGQPASS
ncbi:hypothetical protein [Kineococcus sp. SYSU DK005]|uniref:hypothetical protein n=1 Tax=Kineococcus sp. SYSU DK005 TaxID=3383126 RepID=UPI003D7EF18E